MPNKPVVANQHKKDETTPVPPAKSTGEVLIEGAAKVGGAVAAGVAGAVVGGATAFGRYLVSDSKSSAFGNSATNSSVSVSDSNKNNSSASTSSFSQSHKKNKSSSFTDSHKNKSSFTRSSSFGSSATSSIDVHQEIRNPYQNWEKHYVPELKNKGNAAGLQPVGNINPNSFQNQFHVGWPQAKNDNALLGKNKVDASVQTFRENIAKNFGKGFHINQPQRNNGNARFRKNEVDAEVQPTGENIPNTWARNSEEPPKIEVDSGSQTTSKSITATKKEEQNVADTGCFCSFFNKCF